MHRNLTNDEMSNESAIAERNPRAMAHGDPSFLTSRLGATFDRVLDSVGGFGSMEPIGDIRPEVADDAGKMLVRSRRGRPVAVLKCSSPVDPLAIARAGERIARAREALGLQLGRVILDPLATGEVDGCTYRLLPYCRPLSTSLNVRRIQRLVVAPKVYQWLRGVVGATARDVPAEQLDTDFTEVLGRISRDSDWLDAQERDAAARAIERLKSSAWRPRHVLVHNDLFEENILLSGPPWWAAPQLVIIDWGGSRVAGHAMYDLIRAAMSLRTSRRRLRGEILAHCALLGCSVEDGGAYLLAALGHIENHLNHFPRAEFLKVARSCWETFVTTTRGN